MNAAAAGIGGFFGAMARYALGIWMPAPDGFPFGTLLANLSGCFFLAWFFTATTGRLTLNPRLKLAVGTGFTGSFTTFSTFSVETLQLISDRHIVMAAIYVLASAAGGLGLAALGVRIARKFVRRAAEGSVK